MSKRWPRRPPEDDGVTLVEACLAVLVISIAAFSAGQLFTVAMTGVTAARLQTTATTLAVQKIEQLRSLVWRFEGSGTLQAQTDGSTNISQEPVGGSGPGLSISGPSLDSNVPGYVDFVDQRGRWVGAGASPPPSAVFIRRWSVTPLPTDPADSLVLRVLVTTVIRESQVPSATPRRRLTGDAMLVTVLTRKAW